MFTFAVRVIWFRKRSSPDNSFLGSQSVLPSGDGEDVSELGVSGTSVVTPVLDPSADGSSNTVVGIKSVWDLRRLNDVAVLILFRKLGSAAGAVCISKVGMQRRL